jgi:A/G-specific adenine glycosylase
MKYLVFSKKILSEYGFIKRDLPWRTNTTIYNTWISEIILQQTRVNQGINFYYRFIERFPNIEALAIANEEDVLKMWQGLGYYSRARNLHSAAKQIFFEMNGVFPSSFSELKKLKGVGKYTAAAIASICFNEPVAAIDGNVLRVLARYFGIETPINSSDGEKIFSSLAAKVLDNDEPGTFNQAMMEFGALKCTPKKPLCFECSLQSSCFAFTKGMAAVLPVKTKKGTVRDRFLNYIVLEYNDFLFFNKRTKNDIWKNLYDFPLIETTTNILPEQFINSNQWNDLFKHEEVTLKNISDEIIHILSHQKIHARFYYLTIKTEKNFITQFNMINKLNIFELPLPKIIDNYIGKMDFIK